MSLHRIAIASILAVSLGLAACGGGSAGDTCYKDDECGSGLICADIAVCGPEEAECPGICGQTCETNADCPEGIICGPTTGGIRICHESVEGLPED